MSIGLRAFLVVVPGIVDTIVGWVEPHLPGIEGFNNSEIATTFCIPGC
jgi:hypothetical protein